MRNQSWTPEGKLTEDIEIYQDDGRIKARDLLTNEIREANEDERQGFLYLDLRKEWQTASTTAQKLKLLATILNLE